MVGPFFSLHRGEEQLVNGITKGQACNKPPKLLDICAGYKVISCIHRYTYHSLSAASPVDDDR